MSPPTACVLRGKASRGRHDRACEVGAVGLHGRGLRGRVPPTSMVAAFEAGQGRGGPPPAPPCAASRARRCCDMRRL
jgi:hypothetical protein